MSWSGDEHIHLDIILRLFCNFFNKLKLVFFTANVNGLKVFCVGNSSHSFMLIPLKLYKCLGHGRKMCISFGYNPQKMVVIVTTKVHGFKVFYGCNSSFKFMLIPLKLRGA